MLWFGLFITESGGWTHNCKPLVRLHWEDVYTCLYVFVCLCACVCVRVSSGLSRVMHSFHYPHQINVQHSSSIYCPCTTTACVCVSVSPKCLINKQMGYLISKNWDNQSACCGFQINLCWVCPYFGAAQFHFCSPLLKIKIERLLQWWPLAPPSGWWNLTQTFMSTLKINMKSPTAIMKSTF